ncbi:MAG: toll/interleukin-1 receptor domain-containing protein, partial [Sciscionella sp.]
MIFISYSEQDKEIAAEIAAWVSRRDIAVFNWLAPEQRGGRFLEQIQKAMSVADDFLALMSPHYIKSYWCQREKDLALQREQDIRVKEPARNFIHVLVVAETPLSDMGFLRDYDHVKLTAETDIEIVLAALSERLASKPGDKVPIADPDDHLDQSDAEPHSAVMPAGPSDVPAGVAAGRDQPIFRNREAELEKVLRGLTNPAGPHFWLVVAPPQLGKTWFLNRVRTEITASDWSTRLVDLRRVPRETRTDLRQLLALLFDIDPPVSVGAEEQHAIAIKICETGTSHLCMLDSAELLEEPATSALRECLSGIYRLIDDAAGDTRLGIVITGRKEDGWRGATPPPRISILQLTEFSVNVVHQALFDLAQEMGRDPYKTSLGQVSTQVHGTTEGLPALLAECIQWIRTQHWVALNRLARPEQLKQLAQGYVYGHLLSQESLSPGSGRAIHEHSGSSTDFALYALDRAFRALVPYRLFTQSHVRHQLEHNPDLAAAIAQVDWSTEDLWNAISDSALLIRPLDEPWQQINSAIRRLLYNYFYDSPAKRSEVHRDALSFVAVWGEKQYG